jgi:hypothetical protein
MKNEEIVQLRRKSPAPNWRFHASGGVCPQKHLCEFASASPARTLVNPPLPRKAPERYAPAEQLQFEQKLY